MERTERSFEKNGKERKELNVLLKRTDAQPWKRVFLCADDVLIVKEVSVLMCRECVKRQGSECADVQTMC